MMDDIGRALGDALIGLIVMAFVAGGAVFGLLYWVFSHLRVTVGWE